MKYNRIDIEEALSQLGGSEKLYKTLINGFYDKYQQVDLIIEKQLKDREFEEARRMAHSIKGLSGNLGTKVLREKSQELEVGIRDQVDDLPELLGAFSDELKAVIVEVRQLLVERYGDLAEHGIVKHYGEDIFSQVSIVLIEALETYRYSEVKKAFESFVAVKVPLKYKLEVESVVNHIEKYDYDVAIEILKAMVKY